MDGVRFCRWCNLSKTDGDFYKYRGRQCKKCVAAETTKRRATPEGRAKHKQQYAAWRLRNWDREMRRITAHNRYKKYGITDAEYNTMLTEQGNTCKICRSTPTREQLSVDHDHSSGRIRGLLCRRCNRMLGFVRDSEALLIAMYSYLTDAWSFDEDTLRDTGAAWQRQDDLV